MSSETRRDTDILSKKEIECLHLAAQDLTIKQMVEALQRTPDTIKRHRARAVRKLGCNTMAGAIMTCVRLNIIKQAQFK